LAWTSVGDDLGPSALVADLAAGTGDLSRALAASGYRPIAFDLSAGMLGHARTTAPLVQGDCLRLPTRAGAFDGAVSGFALRNFVDLGLFFDELARVISPGGRVALLDVAQPPHPILRVGHRLYFGHVVPRIGGLLSDPAAYRYLPKSAAYLPEPPAMLARLEAAGFGAVRRSLLSGGIAQLITATRRVDTVAERLVPAEGRPKEAST
jgi:demethylmenaquinone methyltransferase/2-methoxy-6-polyprenyl-1,4-benzoquinol methylase